MNQMEDPRLILTSTLLQAGRHWRRLAGQVLAAHDISEARAATMIWIRRLGGGVRQVTLAAYVGIEGTSIVRSIDELSTLGLVERRNDPEDRRANTVWLTEAGEMLAERIEQEVAELRNTVLSDINEADIEATLRVFKALDQAVLESRDAAALLSKRRYDISNVA